MQVVASAAANYSPMMLNLKPAAAEIVVEMVAHLVDRVVALGVGQQPRSVAALDRHYLTDYSPVVILDDFVLKSNQFNMHR